VPIRLVAVSRLAAVVLFVIAPAAAHAQGAPSPAVLPGQRYFASPLADPVEPRFAIGLLVTDLFQAQGRERSPFTVTAGDDTRDTQAAAAVGGTIPLLRLIQRPQGGIVIAAQAGVFARFRVEVPSRDDLGQDWVVGMPIEARWNDLSARIRIVHRSAHLGDEFSAASGAQRIEFGGETLDLLAAVRRAGMRAYGGGGWIFHSNTDNTDVLVREDRTDRFTLQAGADGSWRPWPEQRLGVVAGVDWQAAERTRWRSALSLAAGLEYRYDGRSAQFLFRLLDGASPMGQFFLTNERYGSLELVLAF